MRMYISDSNIKLESEINIAVRTIHQYQIHMRCCKVHEIGPNLHQKLSSIEKKSLTVPSYSTAPMRS
jgi:hypothetical protein